MFYVATGEKNERQKHHDLISICSDSSGRMCHQKSEIAG